LVNDVGHRFPKSGFSQLGETLELYAGSGHKGPHATEVLSVDPSTAAPVIPPRSDFRTGTLSSPSSNTIVEEIDTVKWFDPRELTA